MSDDGRFQIYHQMLNKLCDAFGVPGAQTFDEAIAWIARHYGPVGTPPEDERPAVPSVLQDAVAPPDGAGIRRPLDGCWVWAKDQRTGGPALYAPPGNVVRIEGGKLEIYGAPTVSIRNLLCLLAVHMGDYSPATLRGMGLECYPDAPDAQPQTIEWDTPIRWYFPRGTYPWWETKTWSSATRNGGWVGYTWKRLVGKGGWWRRESNWARLTLRVFIPRRRP